GHQPRSPSRLPPTSADPLLQLLRELARRAVRPTRAIKQTRQRPPRVLASLQPTMPPTMRSRRRDAEGGRGRLQAHPTLDRLHKRKTTSQSELGVTVQSHPGASFGRESWQTHSLKGAPD